MSSIWARKAASLRHEQIADAVVSGRRQRDAVLRQLLAEEAVRDLRKQAGAVAHQRIGADRAAMRQVLEHGEAVADDLVRLDALHVRDEADAAGIVLAARIVEAVERRVFESSRFAAGWPAQARSSQMASAPSSSSPRSRPSRALSFREPPDAAIPGPRVKPWSRPWSRPRMRRRQAISGHARPSYQRACDQPGFRRQRRPDRRTAYAKSSRSASLDKTAILS